MIIKGQDTTKSSLYPLHALGQKAEINDGRKFRYAKAVAATVAGKAYSSSGQDAQFESMAVNAIEPIGEKQISITLGTTTVTANMFVDGYAVISSSTGIGQLRKIISHGTGTSGETINVELEKGGLETALAATSKLTMIRNPYVDVIVQATTPVAPVMGLAVSVIPTDYYGWLATGGVAAGLFDAGANITVDTLAIAPSTTTEGCIAVAVDANSQILGHSLQVVSVDAYESPVWLTLD